MIENCILCGLFLYERAHVSAKRYFDESIDSHTQNIIPLCPTCHTVFDLGYVTIHPEYKIFVFSKVRNNRNIFLKYNYSYPHTEGFDRIQKEYLERQAKYEFKRIFGESELKERFTEKPPVKLIYFSHLEKYE